jgi:glycosyltransferase involved in cell wall biosynthesis
MPMKRNDPLVVMVANYPRETGYAWWLMERYWDEIADAAKASGWQSVVAYPPDRLRVDSGAHDSIENLVAFLAMGRLRDVLCIYRLLRQFNVRSLYLTDRPFRSWRYLVLRLAGVRSIVVHDHTPGDRPTISGARGLVKRILNSFPGWTANLVVAISPLMRQRQILNARVPSARVTTVTNGVVVRDIEPKAREFVQDRYHVSSDQYVICAVGRLTRYKRFDFAVQCVEALIRNNPETNPVLMLVGDGPERSRLEELVDARNLGKHVIFAGQVDDVWQILCGVDVVIHPSAGEGLSLAILEAMAAARAIVVPGIPSVAQTIDHGITGLVYQEGSLSDASTMLRDLSRNRALRTRLGANARRKVREHYQLDHTLGEFRTKVVPALTSLSLVLQDTSIGK